MSTPSGIGVYARQLSRATHGTPDEMARKLADNHVSFVAFLACWQDVDGGKPRQQVPDPFALASYANACHRAGIKVWLWGFPWLGRETQFVDVMHSATRTLGGIVEGWIFDPEVSYRDAHARTPPSQSRGQGEASTAYVATASASAAASGARRLMSLEAASRADLNLSTCGISSYGMSQWHALPWHELSGGTWGSPQLYSVTPEQVDAGIADWRKNGFGTLLPSVPAYGPNSGRMLDTYLGSFVDGNENVDGFLVWSFQQLDDLEWRTLAKWSDQLIRRAC